MNYYEAMRLLDKVREGTIYSKLDKETWVKSGLWNETKCITEVTK